MWPNSYTGELLQADMVHTAYICCFFRFDAGPKKLFVSFNYHVLFVCLAPVVFKVNNADIQYFRRFLDIQTDFIRSTLTTPTRNMVYFLVLLV